MTRWLALLLLLAACAQPWRTTTALRRQTVPCDVPKGCFAREPDCVISWCFCPLFCSWTPDQSPLSPIWARGGVDGCRCV